MKKQWKRRVFKSQIVKLLLKRTYYAQENELSQVSDQIRAMLADTVVLNFFLKFID